MSRLARVAIGSVQPGADSSFACWALMSALERAGLRVQNFAARACFSPREFAATITGQATRHLDTWLLEPTDCRLIFERGAVGSDLALISGAFDSSLSEVERVGGNLATLCEWLDLPAIAVVDACQLRDCQLPERPARLDGVLIDNARCCSERCRLQTWLEALWGTPVLGFLEDRPELRAEYRATLTGAAPPKSWFESLADVLPESVVRRIACLANSRELAWKTSQSNTALLPQRSLRVAMAYDDAFHCYFPDTLDQLEVLGAEMVDFSPLRDDRLPPDVDLVFFGCGQPEKFAETLAENCCLIASLKQYIENGGRVYAECGGLAYLGHAIDLPDGKRLAMSGILPIESRVVDPAMPPEAVELSLADDCWLGEAGAILRGYRTGRWLVEPRHVELRSLGDDSSASDVLVYHNTIGSRLHLNFAMQPALLNHLFEPHFA